MLGKLMNDFVSASSMSNMTVGKAFNAILKGIGLNDLGEILFNWNESQLNEDGDKIFRYPGRDGRFSRGKEGGKVIIGKQEFMAWLLSDDPFDEKVYGANIRSDTEWTSLIRRAREAALGGIESRSMPITVVVGGCVNARKSGAV
jgi:hypothetical protein